MCLFSAQNYEMGVMCGVNSQNKGERASTYIIHIIQGATIECLPPILHSYVGEGVNILLPHPVVYRLPKARIKLNYSESLRHKHTFIKGGFRKP